MEFRALVRVGDFGGIHDLMLALPDRDPLLNEIGVKFMAGGSHERAAEAFLKLGDVNKAIEACGHLNQWASVVGIVRGHPEVNEQEIMGRYAAYLALSSHRSAALRICQEFRLPREAAMLLDKEGELAFRARRCVFSQKCFVFSAQLLEEVARVDPTGRDLADVTWRKAEAVPFFMLAHRQMYAGQWEDALATAVRLEQVYSEFVGQEKVCALLAICGYRSGYLKRCSDGFIGLESATTVSRRKRERISHIALSIFGKHRPNDPAELTSVPCRTCHKPITAPNAKCSCGFVTLPSVVSGKAVYGPTWRCGNCKRYAANAEIVSFQVCPLCHAGFQAERSSSSVSCHR
jgi:WD repeat-containing protein 35